MYKVGVLEPLKRFSSLPKDNLEEYLAMVHDEPNIMEMKTESKRSAASMRSSARYGLGIGWKGWECKHGKCASTGFHRLSPLSYKYRVHIFECFWGDSLGSFEELLKQILESVLQKVLRSKGAKESDMPLLSESSYGSPRKPWYVCVSVSYQRCFFVDWLHAFARRRYYMIL